MFGACSAGVGVFDYAKRRCECGGASPCTVASCPFCCIMYCSSILYNCCIFCTFFASHTSVIACFLGAATKTFIVRQASVACIHGTVRYASVKCALCICVMDSRTAHYSWRVSLLRPRLLWGV